MQTLVGIIRTGPELDEALGKLGGPAGAGGQDAGRAAGTLYNPGWNLATDLPMPC